MVDPQLNLHLAETKELKDLWALFHEYFKLGVKGEGMTPDNDDKFLELKSRIAILHDGFMAAVRGQEPRQTGQNMMALVGRSITLRHINRMTDVDIKKINLEWHECFLLLNEQVGVLEDRVAKLADVNPVVYNLKKAQKRAVANAKAFLNSIGFKILAVIGVLIGAGFVFVATGAGEHMKKVSWLAPVYWGGVDFYRTWVNSTYPYESIERLMKDRRSYQEGWTEVGSARLGRQAVEAMFTTELNQKLAGAKEYLSIRINYRPSAGGFMGGDCDIHVWLFPSTTDTTIMLNSYRDTRNEYIRNGRNEVVEQAELRRRFTRWQNAIIVFADGPKGIWDGLMENTYTKLEKP